MHRDGGYMMIKELLKRWRVHQYLDAISGA